MNSKKFVELDDLTRIIQKLKKQGKKVVHCHGVFDLIHVGHIRHLKEARKFGDILIVTVTPDQYVNKGPHRPAFTEKLRAEVIASLDCVDYVAINKWPSAVETIKVLKPDYYVKGIEYRKKEDDHTKCIIFEEEAIKKVGGELKFTEDIVFSSSTLINKYFDVLSPEVKHYLKNFVKKYPSDVIIDYLEKLKHIEILIIGEAIIDEYQYGQPIGKAAKESIIALKYLKTEKFAGGALAIANHLASFCDNVDLFTLLGDQNTQEQFISHKLNKKIKKLFHYKKNSPTIIKRRFIENEPLRKLLEFYIINDNTLDNQQTEELRKHLKKILPNYNLVLVADFGHGMFTAPLINEITNKSKFLALNTQTNAGNMGYHFVSKYPRANYICTDERELRLECRDRHSDLPELLTRVAKKMSCNKIIATYGGKGCITYASGYIDCIPAFTSTIIDTMGAGDAFFSLTAPLVTINVPMEIVGFIGNAVGAMYVKVIGNKEPIKKAPLYKYITSLTKW